MKLVNLHHKKVHVLVTRIFLNVQDHLYMIWWCLGKTSKITVTENSMEAPGGYPPNGIFLCLSFLNPSLYLGIIGGNWFPSSPYVFEYIQIYASPKYSSQPPANGGEGGIWIFQSISQSRKETCVEICQGIILQMIQFWYIKLPANWGNIGLRIQKPKLVDAPSAPLIQPFPKSKTQIHKSWKTRNRVAKCHISQGYVCAKNWVMKFGRTQMLINIWECQILWISWHYLPQISTSTTIHIQLINQVGLSIYLFKRGKI